ncbi:unnamed protein product [Heligmosomoides polygyrus]|uniref:WH2 domain-containing protein n=1 Tax=Heligmosomoides polygyrus TaxID=6339 RepID=A0A183FPE3_HELPZ|nr:unnamed protein product [Heligmosomoides polygyrus]
MRKRARAAGGRAVASVHSIRKPMPSMPPKSSPTPPPKPKTAVPVVVEQERAYGVLEKRTQTVDEPDCVPEANVAGKPPDQPAPAPTQAPAPEPFAPVRAPTVTAAEYSPAPPDAFVPARDPRLLNTPLLATQRVSPRIAPVQPANAFNAYNPPRPPQPAPGGPPKTFDNRGIASVNIEDAKPRNKMGAPPPSMFYS